MYMYIVIDGQIQTSYQIMSTVPSLDIDLSLDQNLYEHWQYRHYQSQKLYNQYLYPV